MKDDDGYLHLLLRGAFLLEPECQSVGILVEPCGGAEHLAFV
jgi:hypothetical protein